MSSAAGSKTIYALATPPGRSGIAVVRIAGPNSLRVLQQLRLPGARSPKPRQAIFTTIYGGLGRCKQPLDHVLCIYFASPHSYTGDDIVELQLHGSPAVARAVLSAINSTQLAEPAEPGEYTKRAFLNNKMDLTQVEGIRDLLEAETEMQRRAAISAARGVIARKFSNWRDEIVRTIAMLATVLDFTEDNQIETTENELLQDAEKRVTSILAEARHLTHQTQFGEIASTGVRVAIVGAPNAGKSSLLNRLVERNASIVSDVPGTTRDVVSADLDISGFKLKISDTAGIRKISNLSPQNKIEALGIERAQDAIKDSHVVLCMRAADTALTTEIRSVLSKLSPRQRVIFIANKSDLTNKLNHENEIELSCKTGAGIEKLVNRLAKECESLTDGARDIVSVSQRTTDLVRNKVIPALTRSLGMLQKKDAILASAELDIAANAIGHITGRKIQVTEIFDVIFGSFCIGK